MKTNHLVNTAKATLLAATLAISSVSMADGIADRRSQINPFDRNVTLSVPAPSQPQAPAEHPHAGNKANVPHAVDHRRNPVGSPYQGNDYSGRTAVENRRLFFGNNGNNRN